MRQRHAKRHGVMMYMGSRYRLRAHLCRSWPTSGPTNNSFPPLHRTWTCPSTAPTTTPSSRTPPRCTPRRSTRPRGKLWSRKAKLVAKTKIGCEKPKFVAKHEFVAKYTNWSRNTQNCSDRNFFGRADIIVGGKKKKAETEKEEERLKTEQQGEEQLGFFWLILFIGY